MGLKHWERLYKGRSKGIKPGNKKRNPNSTGGYPMTKRLPTKSREALQRQLMRGEQIRRYGDHSQGFQPKSKSAQIQSHQQYAPADA